MRIAFIGHSYHFTTGSNEFLLDLLRGAGAVDCFLDASWAGEAGDAWATDFRQSDYDAIVVFQAHEAFRRLDTQHANLTFVPMYDAMVSEDSLYWREEFGRAKVLCFSAALDREVSRLAPIRHFAQYFPDPAGLPAAGAASGEGPSAFFWYRRPPITPELVAKLVGRARLERLTLHWAPDPLAEHREPRRLPRARRSERTSWFVDRADYLAQLAEHTLFFAPRLDEGLGHGFLEAMAMGLCVVAPARPTHDEVISHGVDGLLYDPRHPAALDLTAHREIGERARARIARGREVWEHAAADVLDFVLTPHDRLAVRRAIVDYFATVPPPASTARVTDFVRHPKVTVVTVSRNAADALEATMASVLAQDYPDCEYLVLDGGSTDGSVAIIERYAGRLSFWRSRPDDGAWAAMHEALDHAHGDFVLFMNAGDVFSTPRALTLLMAGVPQSADVIFGHHVFARIDGVDELRIAADFETTGRDLERGRLSQRWLHGIPCHQATAVRVHLLREFGFDPELRIAADHDLYFRLRRAGAHFHSRGEVVAIYSGGGASYRDSALCFEEWMRIAIRHGKAGAARRFYRASFLHPEPIWEATLRGWLDRLGRRAERRFGAEAAGSGTSGREPRTARRTGGAVRLLARAIAAVERALATTRTALYGPARSTPPLNHGAYRARFEDGIDFRRPGRPTFVARWSGLSFREDWGRWSEGSRVEIHFERPLPRRLELVVTACAIGENCRLPIRVRVGDSRGEISLTSDGRSSPSVPSGAPAQSPIRTVAIELETSGQERALVFEIPRPISPAELRPGTTSDRRALGVGFQSLRIERR